MAPGDLPTTKKVVSVIICTRNRAAVLEQTLRSVLACDVPSDLDVELLVVDNGSTDSTPGVIRNAQAAGPSNFRVRHLTEQRSGKSRACNYAIRESAGAALIWTDDDVLVPREWIARLARPLLEGTADLVIGGWTTAGDAKKRIDELVGRGFDRGPETSDYLLSESNPTPVGLNYGFHRRVLEHVPGFDEAIGPGMTGLGDDTLFGLRARQAGCRIVVMEDVRVEHFLEASRLDADQLVTAARNGGRSSAYLDYHFHGIARNRLGMTLRLLAAWLDFRRFKWTSNEVQREYARRRRAFTSAYAMQYLSESMRPRKYAQSNADGDMTDAAARRVSC